MLRKSLLLGLSTAALSAALASTASAQNTQNGCGAPTTNTCNVTQAASRNNSSSITISGAGNGVTVNQSGSVETSIVQITGNTNTVNHQQGGVLDRASTLISGNNNASAITQGAGSENNAVASLTGDNNSSTISQSGTGTRNSASITAQGNSLLGSIRQNTGATRANNNTAIINLGSTAAVSAGTLVQNVAVTQFQAGNSASVFVRGGNTITTAGAQGQNSATVIQENLLFRGAAGGGFEVGTPGDANNPLSQNVADVSIAGQANGVRVEQDGVQNNANVSVNRGIAANSVAVTNANFAAGRSGRNSATIDQNGQANRALVSIGGRDAGGQQGLGNNLSIIQGIASGTGRGTGHSATVFQFGQLSQVTLNQQDNTATVGSTDRQGASTADISQSSFYSTVSVTQNGGNDAVINQGGGTSVNNSVIVSQTDLGSIAGGVGGGGAFPPSTPGQTARNFVNISQAGGTLAVANGGNDANVNQSGLNQSATVFQRLGSVAGDVFIAQGTAGATAGGQGAPTTFLTDAAAAQANGTGLNQNNAVSVEQGGGAGRIQVRQDGANLSATVIQNSANNSADGGFDGRNGAVANVSQVGVNQIANVNQTGANSTATVDQRNGAAAGANTTASVVTITQVGGGVNTAAAPTNNQNIAIARQGIGGGNGTSSGASLATGPAGDPDARAAGSFANRIEISQTNQSTGTGATTGGNLYAEAEQQGAGQLARITQSGSNNTAQIFQGSAATNAIAIINQSGRTNSFVVNQTVANQFIRVTQTGSNNQTVTGSGTTGGTTAGAPVFTAGPN